MQSPSLSHAGDRAGAQRAPGTMRSEAARSTPPQEHAGELPAPALPRMHQALEVLNLEDGALLEGRDAQETEYLRAVANWSREYLIRPHPDLGRPGSVCPWVEKSIQRGLYHFTLMPQAHLRMDEVERTFQVMRKHFLEMEPVAFSEGQYKAIVTVFTGLPHAQESEFIRRMHERLKQSFVRDGLMLGEFYPTNLKTGLRNPEWHPLRSSPPLLVIRCMVRPDIAFLSDSHEFAWAYLSRFPQEGSMELRRFIERNRARLEPQNVAMLEETLREFQESQVASAGAGC